MSRRSALAIVSVGLHAAFFLALAWIPTPERIAIEEQPGATPIEIIELPGEEIAKPGAPVALAEEVTEEEQIAAPEIAAPLPAGPSSRSSSRTRTRAMPPGERAIDPAAATLPSPDVDTKAGTKPSANALALHGLRDLDDARATAPSPRFSPSAIGPKTGGTSKGTEDGEVFGPLDRGTPRTLADAGFTRDRKGNMVYREPSGHFVAKMLPDGRVHFKDKIVRGTPLGVTVPDLYTVVRKAQGRELWALQKSKLLKQTFELRLAVAIAFAEDNIDRRIKALYRELIDAWSADRPAVARRKTIFDRWDECDESMRVKLPGFEDATDTRIDDLRRTAGERARDEIHAFIRRHIPKGSEDAYGDPEIAELNRNRKSKARFAPYDDPKPR
jgi:hypothetical protein